MYICKGRKVLQAVFASWSLAVIASPFGSVILSVSEESRFSGQAPAKQSRFAARDKLRNLAVHN